MCPDLGQLVAELVQFLLQGCLLLFRVHHLITDLACHTTPSSHYRATHTHTSIISLQILPVTQHHHLVTEPTHTHTSIIWLQILPVTQRHHLVTEPTHTHTSIIWLQILPVTQRHHLVTEPTHTHTHPSSRCRSCLSHNAIISLQSNHTHTPIIWLQILPVTQHTHCHHLILEPTTHTHVHHLVNRSHLSHNSSCQSTNITQHNTNTDTHRHTHTDTDAHTQPHHTHTHSHNTDNTHTPGEQAESKAGATMVPMKEKTQLVYVTCALCVLSPCSLYYQATAVPYFQVIVVYYTLKGNNDRATGQSLS